MTPSRSEISDAIFTNDSYAGHWRKAGFDDEQKRLTADSIAFDIYDKFFKETT